MADKESNEALGDNDSDEDKVREPQTSAQVCNFVNVYCNFYFLFFNFFEFYFFFRINKLSYSNTSNFFAFYLKMASFPQNCKKITIFFKNYNSKKSQNLM